MAKAAKLRSAEHQPWSDEMASSEEARSAERQPWSEEMASSASSISKPLKPSAQAPPWNALKFMNAAEKRKAALTIMDWLEEAGLDEINKEIGKQQAKIVATIVIDQLGLGRKPSHNLGSDIPPPSRDAVLGDPNDDLANYYPAMGGFSGEVYSVWGSPLKPSGILGIGSGNMLYSFMNLGPVVSGFYSRQAGEWLMENARFEFPDFDHDLVTLDMARLDHIDLVMGYYSEKCGVPGPFEILRPPMEVTARTKLELTNMINFFKEMPDPPSFSDALCLFHFDW